MHGLKMILLGIAIILVGGFFLIDPQSHLGGFGELFCFIIGIYYCMKGLQCEY